MAKLRVGVLISGRGSNLQALIEAAAEPAYPAEVVLVISNRAEAQGLQRSAEAGIPHKVIAEPDRTASPRYRRERSRFAARAVGIGDSADDLRGRTPRRGRRGVHPSDRRDPRARGPGRFSGCTVHFVRAETDSGPIIAQAVVPVHDDDDEERLAARILAQEHRLYPLALRLYAEGRLRIDGNRVIVAGGESPEIAALNPAP